MERIQQYRKMAIGTPLGDDKLLLRRMSGREELGRLFRFDVELLSEDPNVDFNKILGQPVQIRVEPSQSGAPVRYFNGYVSRFAQLPSLARVARYRAEVVPWLWFLTRAADCRIFQDMKVFDIIKTVLADLGSPDMIDNRLSEEHEPRPYCVQYRETAFDFISRLMEQEGIYYYFRHTEDGTKLVLADNPGAHEPAKKYETIPYLAMQEGRDDQEYVTEWIPEVTVQPGAYAVQDFNFEKPRVSLQSRSKSSQSHEAKSFEVYDYPGEYAEPKQGDACSRIRMEELDCRHATARGKANARGVAPGFIFQLAQHPRKDQNSTYLVTGAEYELESDEFDSAGQPTGRGPIYNCSFDALDAKWTYRSSRLTPKPVVQGPQTAMVVGPQGEEIHTDKHGRVKVMFHWDRYAKANEKSSCWIRVAQAWAGHGWGAMYIPRVGQEVMVEFLEGDPDRPIIVGRVYNAENVPPYVLPANKTRSTLKSNSYPDGQGFNEIRLEDKKGEEQLFVHAEKDQDVRVKNDSKQWVGKDSHQIVKQNKYELVEQEKHVHVQLDRMEQIDGDDHLTVGGDRNIDSGGTISVTAGRDYQEKTGMNYAHDAGQEIHLKAGMKVIIEAGLQLTIKGPGGFVDIGPMGVTIQGNLVNINSGGSSGAGSGSSPDAPKAPTDALEADSEKPGQVDQAPTAPKPPTPVAYGAQAKVLKEAADSGAPFCEKCEAARAAQQQQTQQPAQSQTQQDESQPADRSTQSDAQPDDQQQTQQ